MATRLFGFTVTNWEPSNPIGTVGKKGVVQQTINFLRQLLAATVSRAIIVGAEYNQVIAQGNVAVASTGSGTQTITINGVACADSWTTNTNTTAGLLVTAVNVTASSDLVTKAVTAKAVYRPALGSYALSSATGTVAASIDSTSISVTAGATDAATAVIWAAAANANGTAGKKFLAIPNYPASGTVTLFARDGATGTFTLTGSAGTYYATINGITVSAAFTATTTATATALAAAINANGSLNALVHATSAAGVVTVVSKGNSGLISVSGTGATVSGGAITISSGSGDISATINNVTTTVTWATSDTATAAALAAALNANTTALNIVQATSSSGVVSVWRTPVADNAILISGAGDSGATCSASGTTLGSAGLTYGGIPGNALTLGAGSASGGSFTRSGTTLTGGLTSVALTAKAPSYAGNWITSAVTGDALTAASARLIGGTATQRTLTFPG